MFFDSEVEIYNDLLKNDQILSQCTEVEFLEEIQTEVLRVFLLAIHRHLYKQIVLPPSVFLDFYSFALWFLQHQLGGGGCLG